MSIETVSKNSDRFKQQGQTVLVIPVDVEQNVLHRYSNSFKECYMTDKKTVVV